MALPWEHRKGAPLPMNPLPTFLGRHIAKRAILGNQTPGIIELTVTAHSPEVSL